MRGLVSKVFVPVLMALAVLVPSRAAAADYLCDPAYQNCRTPLLQLIDNETIGIDVGFWFMQDARYAHALIRKWNEGVPVRVIFDSQAFNDFEYAGADIPVSMMADARIPLRDKTGSGIFHYKMMLFAGQGVVEFSGANYSDEAFVYRTPYENYVDEVIVFADTPSIVNSFKTKFDDAWTDTTSFTNYANVATLARHYDTFPIDPRLNFVPSNNFATRSVTAYRAETQGIDSIMYRVTDQRHSNEMIAAVQRGVPVRFIGEPFQYRSTRYLWVSWNLDRMYMAGVQIRMRSHAGLSHEKLTILRSQGRIVVGSSNWTSASASSQHEHNLFTSPDQTDLFNWSVDHFNRKWNNTGPVPETVPFVPLPPDTLVYKAPADASQNVPFSNGVTVRWYPGQFAHRYDIYLGTSPASLTKIVDDVDLGPSTTTATAHQKSFTIPSSLLQGATTYYWRVVSRTMANMERQGPIWSFRTEGSGPVGGAGDVVLWAMRASTRPGWTLTTDVTAAGGSRLANANAGAPVAGAQAAPTQYFDLTFNAAPGEYRLWIRGRATSNSWSNDSAYVQFSSSVTSATNSTPIWRIGTTSATVVTIEDCSGCGLSGWGWNDNATGVGVLGPTVHLTGTDPHTIRVQVREDGLSIDQIILSPSTYLATSPGETKNDGNIYGEQGGTSGSGTPPPPPPPPPACNATTLPGGWAQQDIGGVASPGSACFNSSTSTYTLNGSGADIWGSADEFQFAYRQLTGDGAIVARVAAVTNPDLWTKAGVMMRETLTANSKHAMMIVSSGKGLAFQRRVSTGGVSTSTAGGTGTAPYWVRLERAGNSFTASVSTDGSAWTVVGAETIAMGPTIFVGLPITSHRDGTIATATLTDVSVTP